jgi:hypothetical protein
MEHAKLSPSKAFRWLSCIPSAHLEYQIAEEETSKAAEEGTKAHELAEKVLKNEIKTDDKHINAYVDFVKSKASYNSELYIEDRVDLTQIVPGGFGTVDAIVIENNLLNSKLHIIDLKTGRYPVQAFQNDQLKLYALGALIKYSFSFESIILHIFQTKINNISSWETTTTDILNWAINIVAPIARQAYDGLGELKPTRNNCKFCKAKKICGKGV